MTGIELIIVIIIFLFSVVFHEVAHGWVAFALGDSTAKRAGRLTLNPLKHLDPIGSVLLPGFLILMKFAGMGGFIFGWAKPVPINPYNFKDQKYGTAKVAIAGSAANFSLALIFGLALRFLPIIYSIQGVGLIFLYIVQINLILAIFNLLPIPPLDGSHILFTFLRKRADKLKMFLVQYGFFLLVFIIFFFFQYIAQAVLWLMQLIIGISI
ncbi:site-2 protease family protein [Patescibacteria group bacterium]|nr:site-2 protease family protein [Patescibacteria group bacterium]MBU4162474.1 site-2 protease family protein [Patescibacteria group bacterium]